MGPSITLTGSLVEVLRLLDIFFKHCHGLISSHIADLPITTHLAARFWAFDFFLKACLLIALAFQVCCLGFPSSSSCYSGFSTCLSNCGYC
jgi:hypothetical protein